MSEKKKRDDFSYLDLHGKTLKIIANRNKDGLIVAGLDVETNKIYVLVQQINPEPLSKYPLQ